MGMYVSYIIALKIAFVFNSRRAWPERSNNTCVPLTKLCIELQIEM